MSDQSILITGATGSLGTHLVRKLLLGAFGAPPERLIAFSRDEDKQATLENTAKQWQVTNHPVLEMRLGDVRDYHSLAAALQGVDVVIHAAALKHVPRCQENVSEAVATNVVGVLNIERFYLEHPPTYKPVRVIGVSTDKAVEPINAMGATKFLQECVLTSRRFNVGNLSGQCVRYGNVVGSRGSVVPNWKSQIEEGKSLTLTDERMTRFLLTLDQAATTIAFAMSWPIPGCIIVPFCDSCRLADMAAVMQRSDTPSMQIVGIRPGEKIHETLISSHELRRLERGSGFFIIRPDWYPPIVLVTEEAIGSRSSDENLAARGLIAKYLADWMPKHEHRN